MTYHHQDHLSVRVNTNSSGTTVGEQGHLPFGESWYMSSSTTKWQFTSYERDAETGLDYATFRYDSSRLGRFLTPDPLAGSIANPQSLNRYAYVNNDPVGLVDPLGLQQETPAPNVCVINGIVVSGLVCDLPLLDEGFFPPLLIFRPGGRGPRRPQPPGLPTFTQQDYEDCAQKAFGGTQGGIPGTNSSIPGFEAALAVFQESLLVGADAAVVGATMALESNSNLQVPNSPLNRNGTVDIGPMQLNTGAAGKYYRIFGNALGTNLAASDPFNGDVRANIATGAAFLRDLGPNPEFFFSRSSDLAAQRRQALDTLLPSMQTFFDCLAGKASPQTRN